MREPYTKVYLHLVWATVERLPLLTPDVLHIVDLATRQSCVRMRVEVLAFGGVADHVHLLVRIPTNLAIGQIVKQVKGSTSHLLTQKLGVPFRWQGGYGVFSVSASVVPSVRAYVLNQEEHHRDGTTVSMAELPADPAPTPTG